MAKQEGEQVELTRRQLDLAEGRAKWAEGAGVVAYFLLVPFALWGIVPLWRRRRDHALILLAPALLATLSSAIGYGNPRFRHAFEISFVVLAALAMVALAEGRRAR